MFFSKFLLPKDSFAKTSILLNLFTTNNTELWSLLFFSKFELPKSVSDYYHQHQKDGEGTVFNVLARGIGVLQSGLRAHSHQASASTL